VPSGPGTDQGRPSSGARRRSDVSDQPIPRRRATDKEDRRSRGPDLWGGCSGRRLLRKFVDQAIGLDGGKMFRNVNLGRRPIEVLQPIQGGPKIQHHHHVPVAASQRNLLPITKWLKSFAQVPRGLPDETRVREWPGSFHAKHCDGRLGPARAWARVFERRNGHSAMPICSAIPALSGGCFMSHSMSRGVADST
jgi:hypothetical protein